MKNSKCVCSSNSLSFEAAACLTGLTLLVMGLWLTSCAPDTGVSTNTRDAKPADITGAYTLGTINGNPLPYTPPHEGGAPRVTSGTFTIKADGTCSSKLQFNLPSGAASSREVNASYTRAGTKLHMKWQGAGETIGTIEGNTFTMDNEGVLFAYRK